MGVCRYVYYFCAILHFLPVSYKMATIRVVFSFGVCLSVCLFVSASLKNGWLVLTELGIGILPYPE